MAGVLLAGPNLRPLFDTSAFRSAGQICNFLESGAHSVFYDHTKAAPPARMTGNDDVDRKNRDAGLPRHRGDKWQPSPLAVGVGCCVYNFSDIDARAETYFGHYRLMMKWYVPELSSMLKQVGIARDSDRTQIPLSADEWTLMTKNDVSGYRQFSKMIAVPSFAMNTIGGDPVFTQRYAYVAESTDHPDIITLQLVFHSKFKIMQSTRIRAFPFDEVELDFKIRLWDNKRDGARFFQPLRFPDGTHFLYPMKMNQNLPDWNLFIPVIRLYRQGGMKGENEAGPSVYSVSVIAKRRSHEAFGMTVTNGILTACLLLLATKAPPLPTRDNAMLLLCGFKAIHCYNNISAKLNTPIIDVYSMFSLGFSMMLVGDTVFALTKAGGPFAVCSLIQDALFFGYTKLRERVNVLSANKLPQSNWQQEMGNDFDHTKVTFK